MSIDFVNYYEIDILAQKLRVIPNKNLALDGVATTETCYN
jgi:hypothetical protein